MLHEKKVILKGLKNVHVAVTTTYSASTTKIKSAHSESDRVGAKWLSRMHAFVSRWLYEERVVSPILQTRQIMFKKPRSPSELTQRENAAQD